MNRPLKFRVWDEKYKRFHYWGFLEVNNILAFVGVESPTREYEALSEQFTGLYDKEGTEIWEGDKLSNLYLGDQEFEVVSKYGSFGYRGYGDFFLFSVDRLKGMKVIGHIHEEEAK